MDFLFDFQVIDHYENPRNVGKLDAKKLNVGTGLVGAPACGDVMKLQVIPKSCTVLLREDPRSGANPITLFTP